MKACLTSKGIAGHSGGELLKFALCAEQKLFRGKRDVRGMDQPDFANEIASILLRDISTFEQPSEPHSSKHSFAVNALDILRAQAGGCFGYFCVDANSDRCLSEANDAKIAIG